MNKIRIPTILFILAAAVSLVLSQQTEHGGRPITATLTGAAEVPGPGDPDGAGSFKATINPGQGQVCYELTVSNIDTPNAAHIHTGGPKDAGPILVPLKSPENGSSKDCLSIEKDKLQEMIKDPSGYYVNVHNAEFKDGAVRGQLSK